MPKNVFILISLLILSGCGAVPNLPSIPELPSLPVTPSAEKQEKQTEVAEVAEMSVACVREGDGFLSFSYEEGRLDTLTLLQADEKITLSKGVTLTQKVPLGTYITIVGGYQKQPLTIETKLGCDGETKAYTFNLQGTSSSGGESSATPRSLAHSMGTLVVGSVMEDFSVKLTKLDAPYRVFEDPTCEEEKVCPLKDSRVFTGAANTELPEGEYFIKPSSGVGQATYIDASSYTAIEVTIDGIEITSQEVVSSPGQGTTQAIAAGLLKQILQ